MAPVTGLQADQTLAGLCGQVIGTGSTRNVYEYVGEPDWVIKAYHRPATPPSSNFIEWTICGAVKGTQFEPLFGQCFAFSETGRFLVMEKLNDIPKGFQGARPRVPDWLHDLKVTAFGLNANGEVKCRDYGQVDIGATLGSAGTKPVFW